MTEELQVSSVEEITKRTKEIFESEATEPELVKLPETGIVVRLRRVDVTSDPVTGGLPLSLVAAAIGVKTEAEEVTSEQIKELSLGMIFMRQTVVENCLEPRIGFDVAGRVSFLDNSGKAIARVHKKDFKYMYGYITGQEAREPLNKFRNREERRTAASSTGRKKFRVQTKRGIQNQEQAVSA